MKHLDLFAGIGGFTLAAEWAGIETVAHCEVDKDCISVLRKHWPNAKLHTDIRELDGNDYKHIDIITGGYPCQPFSVAGNQEAEKDDRHLWPEMLRIITQAESTWAVCENVYGHVRLGLDSVLYDLEAIGYACQPFVIPALATGANHNRDRVFIVAYSSSNGRNGSKVSSGDGKANVYGAKGAKKNSNDERRGGIRLGLDWQGNKVGRWGIEPPPIRVDDELPNRPHRVKMIGNAVDPWIAYQILQCIKAV